MFNNKNVSAHYGTGMGWIPDAPDERDYDLYDEIYEKYGNAEDQSSALQDIQSILQELVSTGTDKSTGLNKKLRVLDSKLNSFKFQETKVHKVLRRGDKDRRILLLKTFLVYFYQSQINIRREAGVKFKVGAISDILNEISKNPKKEEESQEEVRGRRKRESDLKIGLANEALRGITHSLVDSVSNESVAITYNLSGDPVSQQFPDKIKNLIAYEREGNYYSDDDCDIHEHDKNQGKNISTREKALLLLSKIKGVNLTKDSADYNPLFFLGNSKQYWTWINDPEFCFVVEALVKGFQRWARYKICSVKAWKGESFENVLSNIAEGLPCEYIKPDGIFSINTYAVFRSWLFDASLNDREKPYQPIPFPSSMPSEVIEVIINQFQKKIVDEAVSTQQLAVQPKAAEDLIEKATEAALFIQKDKFTAPSNGGKSKIIREELKLSSKIIENIKPLVIEFREETEELLSESKNIKGKDGEDLSDQDIKKLKVSLIKWIKVIEKFKIEEFKEAYNSTNKDSPRKENEVPIKELTNIILSSAKISPKRAVRDTPLKAKGVLDELVEDAKKLNATLNVIQASDESLISEEKQHLKAIHKLRAIILFAENLASKEIGVDVTSFSVIRNRNAIAEISRKHFFSIEPVVSVVFQILGALGTYPKTLETALEMSVNFFYFLLTVKNEEITDSTLHQIASGRQSFSFKDTAAGNFIALGNRDKLPEKYFLNLKGDIDNLKRLKDLAIGSVLVCAERLQTVETTMLTVPNHNLESNLKNIYLNPEGLLLFSIKTIIAKMRMIAQTQSFENISIQEEFSASTVLEFVFQDSNTEKDKASVKDLRKGEQYSADQPIFPEQKNDIYQPLFSSYVIPAGKDLLENIRDLKLEADSTFESTKHFSYLPKLVDLSFWCSPITNQGNLQSCSAQAGASLIEYFSQRYIGDDNPVSRRFLYKTARNLENTSGDTGISLRATIKAMVLFGTPPEVHWNYDESNFDEEPTAFCYSFGQNYQTLSYFRLDHPAVTKDDLLLRIKIALASGLPCMFGFTAYESIHDEFNAQQGYIPYPGKSKKSLYRGKLGQNLSRQDKPTGSHSLVAVGYNDFKEIRYSNNSKEFSKGALLVRNSWGVEWGLNGYGWLPYDYVLKGQTADWWSLLKSEWLESGKFGLGAAKGLHSRLFPLQLC